MVTRDVQGTSSSVAKERVVLRCCMAEGHEGPHKAERVGILWEDRGMIVRMLLCDEAEPISDYFG